MTIQPTAPGAQKLASLTGSELVPVISGGPVQQVCTTDQIAGLASLVSTGAVLTTINTVGAGTLTAAALVGKNINRTGVQTGAFTDTTDTAANIIAALPSGAPIGTAWLVTISNNQTAATGYVETVTGGTGVTVSGVTVIPTGGAAEYLVTYSAAATVTMVGRFVALANSGTLSLAGSSSGQTEVVPAAAASGVLTLPAATDTLVGRATTDTLTNKTLTSPTLTTPALGVATATSINGIALTTGTGTLTLGANTLTLAGNLTTTGAFNSTFAQAATATYTLAGVAGTIAQTSGADLYVADIYRGTLLTITNSVTPTLIPGLAGAVAIGTYRFRAAIYCTPAATGGVAISFVLTTAVLSACNFVAIAAAAAASSTVATTTTTSATNICAVATIPLLVLVEGTFTVSTAGTFSLYGCQNTQVNSAATINLGSYMELTRIA